MTITLLKISRFFLYASVFSVLIVLSSTFFPFIGGKYYFFRVCVEAALIFLFLWWGFEARDGELEKKFQRIMRMPLVIAVSVFVLAVILAVIFAHNPYGAFWSNYERGEGGFQMLHYYAFFLMLVLLFDKDKDWQFLFKLSIAAGIGIILYGVLAANFVNGFIGPYQLDANGQPAVPSLFGRVFQAGNRFQGSLGNPAYVAPYFLFSMFYVLYLFLEKKRRTAMAIGGTVLLMVLFFLFFAQSDTRGAFLGLAAGLLVYFGYLVLRDDRRRRVAIVFVVALAALYGFLYTNQDSAFVKKIPGTRFLDINLTESSAQTRFWTWGSAWQGFLERPIFGWGLENFSVVLDKYFDTRHFSSGGGGETWFDRAHSVFFEYLATTGFVGLGAYLAIFGVFFWLFYRLIMKKKGKSEDGREDSLVHDPRLQALWLAMPSAYLVQGLLLFDVLPIYINFFIFFAFSAYKFSTLHHHDDR